MLFRLLKVSTFLGFLLIFLNFSVGEKEKENYIDEYNPKSLSSEDLIVVHQVREEIAAVSFDNSELNLMKAGESYEFTKHSKYHGSVEVLEINGEDVKVKINAKKNKKDLIVESIMSAIFACFMTFILSRCLATFTMDLLSLKTLWRKLSHK